MFADLPLWTVALLAVSSFLGSALSAALGVGGGSFLIIVMANVLPPIALVPVHGVVQLGSNAGRAWLTRSHRENAIVGWFFAGSVVAAVLSLWLLNQFDASFIPVAVAAFILYLSWGPLPNIGLGRKPWGLALGGLITTSVSVLVGATGPLVSAWLGRDGVSKWQYTANFSSCMTSQHILKLAVFGVAGFAFTPWLGVIGLMIVAGYIGTKVGLSLLDKLPEQLFKTAFRWVLTVLAARILYRFFFAA
ncbi:sulfite exporter TauE/SafE family protein [Halioxenophilus aromaticivorans]